VERADERLNHVEGELRDSRRDLNHGFSWLLGAQRVQISMWIAIILAILCTIEHRANLFIKT